ncbi:MAG: 4-(cytidine 5'-diphospho)-2-C-methyl-D-erythritol kinase [Bacteroidota bacterium]
MISFPNCKINLGLFVTRKRDDGYHDLETVFWPLPSASGTVDYSPLHDALEVAPAATTALHITGRTVAGETKDNLVWKAYLLLQNAFPEKIPSLDIHLHKALPMGAGLGGGSADGAYMLRLLNDYCSLGLSKAQLAEYALQLGSDCPFFIYNTPQFATGRGEQMTGLSLDLSHYSIQLICPQVHVSTAQAFANITPRPATYNLRLLSALPLVQWPDKLRNDFEEPVFAAHPLLASLQQQLYDGGALYAAMSGTGSAIYGIFPKGKKAAVVADVVFEGYYIL